MDTVYLFFFCTKSRQRVTGDHTILKISSH